VLGLSCLAHALHDGYTDMIYVLLPLWQTEFGLGYGALAVLRGLYAGAMAGLQLPAGWLAGASAAAPPWCWARCWRRWAMRRPACRAACPGCAWR
jgi:hypothetical protein